jgi:serine/threonine protein phosphatase PrpC
MTLKLPAINEHEIADLLVKDLFEVNGSLNSYREAIGEENLKTFFDDALIKEASIRCVKVLVMYLNKYVEKVSSLDVSTEGEELNLMDSHDTSIQGEPENLIEAAIDADSKKDIKNQSEETKQSVQDSIEKQATEPLKPGDVPLNAPKPQMPNIKISFSLKNAKMSEPFEEDIQVTGETETKKVTICEVIFPANIGLSFEKRRVKGVPSISGEQDVLVRYLFDNDTEKTPLESKFTFYINPDPESLWLTKESDKSDPYFKEDEVSESLEGFHERTMLAASIRGKSHAHVGSFRDDDFKLQKVNGWNILCVADGAGGSKHSRKGSKIAVNTAVGHLAQALGGEQGLLIENAASSWHANQIESKRNVLIPIYEAFGSTALAAVKAIEEEAAKNNSTPRDYYTTLIVTAHKKIECGHLFASYWVGDGGVGVYDKGKKVILLGEVDSGDFAGQTIFLDKKVMTAEEIMNRIRFTIVDGFTSLVLMTDGVTDPKFETDNNLAKIEKWDEMWHDLEGLLSDQASAPKEIESWLHFKSRGNYDDRTIAILY